MVDLEIYVIGLLVVAAIGMQYIFRVIAKQIGLFKKVETKIIQSFRLKLFAISLVIVIMGMIPIGINIYTLFNDTSRPDKVPTMSVIYSSTVHLQTLLLAYILWRIYRLADDQEDALADLEAKHLEKEKK